MQEKKDPAQKATNLFTQGYNCSQAVVAAFAEELDVDLQTALKIASSFGGGMGRLREVCGAVTGMFIVAGLKYGYTDPQDHEGKTNHYKMIQALAAAFKQQNGSIICKELLSPADNSTAPVPEKRTEAYYKKRPCAELVACAAEILAEAIKEKK